MLYKTGIGGILPGGRWRPTCGGCEPHLLNLWLRRVESWYRYAQAMVGVRAAQATIGLRRVESWYRYAQAMVGVAAPVRAAQATIGLRRVESWYRYARAMVGVRAAVRAAPATTTIWLRRSFSVISRVAS